MLQFLPCCRRKRSKLRCNEVKVPGSNSSPLSFLTLMKKWAKRLFSYSRGMSSLVLLSLMELHHRVQTLRSVFVFFFVLLFLFSFLFFSFLFFQMMKFHSRLTAIPRSIYVINLDQYSQAIPTLRRQKNNFKLSAIFS